MSEKCEVIKVVREGHPNDFVVINKSDLTPGDKKYKEKKETKKDK